MDPHLMDFYSARLLFVVLVADRPGRKRHLYDETVIIFRAKDSAHAFERALELGREQETDYPNDKGHQVRWALVQILNINHIGRSVDGKEVASSLHYRTSKESIPPDHIFHPEKSKPGESF
ncbi:protein of unknown function [Prosthecobacter debontii]|uniref:DUF4288 domain-containing protein n=1 Tax=Prosthecobacter debontii TaxID=48467 RepID=A0A1T4Z4E7_9BACT|nr:DUF4288 domain-containing protein [Prosthecobacter debontii]SKB08947.1 protein of unknown function [Prosthecobacter debontii]